MVRVKTAVAACGAMAMVLAISASGRASGTATGTNYLTFSGPVALPGVELRAGRYIFEKASPDTSASVIRVLSADRKKVFLMAFTNNVVRPDRLKPGQVITLGESAPGVPPPITAWYPLDEAVGHEFIYRR